MFWLPGALARSRRIEEVALEDGPAQPGLNPGSKPSGGGGGGGREQQQLRNPGSEPRFQPRFELRFEFFSELSELVRTTSLVFGL